MTILSLAFKNLKRHNIRTILTMFGIAIASATLFSIFSFDNGYKQALEQELANTGAHLFVSTEGCPLFAASLLIRGGNIPKFLPMQQLAEVKNIAGIKAAGGFLIMSGFSADGKQIDLFSGITDEVLKLKANWRIKGSWFKDENSILLGWALAKNNKYQPGNKIYIQSIDKEFIISGILERTDGEDDNFYFLPLNSAQKIFKKENKLTAIGIQLEDLMRTEEVKAKLESLPEVYVVAAEAMGQEILKFIGGTKALMYSIMFIVFLVSLAGLLNTILMATFERQKEFGYLRCIGAGRLDIIKLILLESLILCLIGAIAGFALGFLLSFGLEQWIRKFLPYVPAGKLLRPDLNIILISSSIVLGLGLLAGFFPAYRASKVSPMEAIRND